MDTESVRMPKPGDYVCVIIRNIGMNPGSFNALVLRCVSNTLRSEIEAVIIDRGSDIRVVTVCHNDFLGDHVVGGPDTWMYPMEHSRWLHP